MTQSPSTAIAAATLIKKRFENKTTNWKSTTTTTTATTTTTTTMVNTNITLNFSNMVNHYQKTTLSDVTIVIQIPISQSHNFFSCYTSPLNRSMENIPMIIEGNNSNEFDEEVENMSFYDNNDDDDSNKSSYHQNDFDDIEEEQFHKTIYEFNAHKIILASNSEYFTNKFHEMKENHEHKIYLKIDFLATSDAKFIKKMMNIFFRLFYVNIIDDSSFEDYDFFTHNILNFHQLAYKFSFESAQQFIEQKISSMFTENSFPSLCDFCIEKMEIKKSYSFKRPSSFPSKNQEYCVPNEKIFIFKKLIEWFEYCIDDEDDNYQRHNHLVKSSLFFQFTSRKENLILSTKSSIRECFIKNIKNFSLFSIIPSSFTYDNVDKKIVLHNFTRICTRCVKQTNKPIFKGYAIMPIHIISYADKSLQFRLKISQSDCTRCQFDVIKSLNNSQRQQQSSSSISPKKLIHQLTATTTHLSSNVVNNRKKANLCLLTKNDFKSQIYEEIDGKQQHKPSIDFFLPNEEECYVSKCHQCSSKRNVTFIIKYNMTIYDHEFT
jgi:hypothetical protein